MKRKNLIILLPILIFVVGCSAGEQPSPGPNPAEHNVSHSWDKDETYHWHYCADPGCEEMFNKAPHTFEWIITKQPTATAKGVRSNKCKICGYVKEKEDIPKLELHYSTEWSSDGTHHWHACTDAGYEDKVFGIDVTEHTLINGGNDIEPTYTEAGSTATGKCSVCNADVEAIEIPKLNEVDYAKESSWSNGVLTETWTLKDATTINRDSYVVTKTHDYGFAIVDDYATGKMVTTAYNYLEFAQKFPGIEINIDKSTKTTTINVAKPGGVILNNVAIIFPCSDSVAGKFIITGYPLTINAPKGVTDPALLFSCNSSSTAYYSKVTIDNQLTLNYSKDYSTANNGYGLKANYIDINAGAKLKISNFANGIRAGYSPINVNGELDITATKYAIVSTNSVNRTIKFASGLKVYFNDVLQSGMTSTDTANIKNNNVTHLQVIQA